MGIIDVPDEVGKNMINEMSAQSLMQALILVYIILCFHTCLTSYKTNKVTVFPAAIFLWSTAVVMLCIQVWTKVVD